MKKEMYRIGEVAEKLGVSVDTLRKWDEKGILKSFRPPFSDKRYYLSEVLEDFLRQARKAEAGDILAQASGWAASTEVAPPAKIFYCKTNDVFSARLQSLSLKMDQDSLLKDIYPLVIAVAGEIGNNSYNHNIGHWPDVPGVFFAHQASLRRIVLADRGQGVLKTLRRVLPEIKTHKEALEAAFTKYISGRAPENRGNGLKFVRDIMCAYPFHLAFWSGNAKIEIARDQFAISQTVPSQSIGGCMALIDY